MDGGKSLFLFLGRIIAFRSPPITTAFQVGSQPSNKSKQSRDCRCAPHDKSRRDGNNFGRSCDGNYRNNIASYKIRRSSSEGSLALSAAANGSGSGVGSSPACSINSSPNPVAVLARSMSRDDLSSAGNDGGMIR
ncbi:hypothetical protein LINGRAHAP2_LOCUS27945 [Linum grandiflorum]